MSTVDLGLGRVALGTGAVFGPEAARHDGVPGESAGEAPSFAEALKGALEQVNAALQESDAAAARLATGEAVNLHEVVLATERANLALQFTMALRNKLLEAYNELMRMPV